MKRISFAALATAMVAIASPAGAQDMKAEVIHWWTSGGESAAVKVFADQFNKAGGNWVDNAIAGGANARTAAINRTVGGNPPTAMQFNTGKQFDDLVENNLLADLDGLASEQKWKSIMPEAIINAVTRNGKVFAVPVNIHGQNWLWYNKSVLDKAGVPEPKNWDETIAALDKIKATGVIPLAFSGQKNWERGLFNAVLVGKGGPKLWVGIYGKQDATLAATPEFKAVAATYKKLRDYVDAGAPGRNWNDATTLVIQGKAGMQIMGDWAKGEFVSAGQTAGKEYGCTVLSGQGVGYVMGGDVFAFPKLKDANQQKAQLALAKIMLEPDTQIKFAQKKGSIPVRLDVDSSSLDQCAQKAMTWLKDSSQQIPAQEMLSPPALTGAMEDVISQFWNTSMTVDQFSAKVADALKQQF
ncbi:ABC transporter substrate-binding protein [Terrarubrum flagellatum]|uniref:ABC transporter substrate-binding protein n=1 Tax=Terrirubrum flagellatum TaxID=2895980 RepID=UPI0031450881